MNILDTIVAQKKLEVAEARKSMPEVDLRAMPGFDRTCISLQQFLLDPSKTGIIAEFKRQSPSRGIINNVADVVEVTRAYANGGASGLSVLTDGPFFGGSKTDLQQARINEIPILRKDFIIDPYQVIESKAIGADVILLIAACLSPGEVQELSALAVALGMEVILELHDASELDHIHPQTGIIGINNRNLKTFEVDVQHAIRLSQQIPAGHLKIAESGIHDIEMISTFKDAGYHGVLMGENFMKAPDPAIAFAGFVHQLKMNRAQ